MVHNSQILGHNLQAIISKWQELVVVEYIFCTDIDISVSPNTIWTLCSHTDSLSMAFDMFQPIVVTILLQYLDRNSGHFLEDGHNQENNLTYGIQDFVTDNGMSCWSGNSNASRLLQI